MKITLASAIQLIHEAAWGSLATLSAQMPGYPFATILPFTLNEQHCPVFLLSDLAEHTKNVLADSRASLLVHSAVSQNVLTAERISIVGDVMSIVPSADLVARYLRYHPDAKDYLALGGFSFYQLMPQRSRYVGGFGQMGWIEIEEWASVEVLPLAEEKILIHGIANIYPNPVRMFGIDCYGFDVEKNGKRTRQRFPDAPVALAQISEVVRRFVAAVE